MLDYISNNKINAAHIKEVENMFAASLAKKGLSDMNVKFTHTPNCVYAYGEHTAYSVPADIPYRASKNALYGLLATLTGETKAWGAMTGVKPVKLYVMCIEAGFTDREAYSCLKRYFSISEPKLDLIRICAENQMSRLYAPQNSFALYVHIPLCVSKCTYCSFPSEVCVQGSELCEDYLNALLYELDSLRVYAERNELFCDCVYIGGGTPSILSAEQISRLLKCVKRIAPDAAEVCFEAGRSDTVGEEKLTVMKSGGVSRISLNPQTTNDATLAKINRLCDTEAFTNAYEIARKVGFESINCDIIFGLEGEDTADFARSMNDIVSLVPENITLHSLCKKKTSLMETSEIESNELPLCAYHDEARAVLAQKGYMPYYAYRQQHAVDNAENTGYARSGKACTYNIRMMGEKQSILSAGAGSTTKIFSEQKGIYRSIYNMKNTSLYIRDIKNITAKKLASMEKIMLEFKEEEPTVYF